MMEVRRARIGAAEERENLVAKNPFTKPSTITAKREILGEVGNRAVAKQQSNILKKQPTKPATVVVQKPKPKTTAIKPILKDKNVKPKILNRQESILTQKFKEHAAPATIPSQFSYSSRQLNDVIDIDKDEEPLMVSEYIKDIIKYLMHVEEKDPIKQGFLAEHSSSVWMRNVLVNWMSDVQVNFKMLVETFHLSVSILDRYLQRNKEVGREQLQLVGTAAIIIASKFEEMYCPEIADFVYICDDSYTKEEILTMERDILKTLNFYIHRPLSIQFLRRYNKVSQASPLAHTLGKYLLELGIFEYNMCHRKQSLLAAAASCLSVAIINDAMPTAVWNKSLHHYSTYSYADIRETICDYAALLLKTESSKYQAIRKKYSSSSSGKISMNRKLSGTIVQKYAKQSKNITL